MQVDVKTGMVQNKKSAVVFRLLLILIEIKKDYNPTALSSIRDSQLESILKELTSLVQSFFDTVLHLFRSIFKLANTFP
jgi:hypothetical protein